MPALINLEKIYLSLWRAITRSCGFSNSSERVCLIGRNGAGKSTFLKIIDGKIDCDSGKIHRETGLTVARLEQELPQAEDLTVYEVVAKAFENYTGEDWQSEQ